MTRTSKYPSVPPGKLWPQGTAWTGPPLSQAQGPHPPRAAHKSRCSQGGRDTCVVQRLRRGERGSARALVTGAQQWPPWRGRREACGGAMPFWSSFSSVPF